MYYEDDLLQLSIYTLLPLVISLVDSFQLCHPCEELKVAESKYVCKRSYKKYILIECRWTVAISKCS
jgi:hypothetical protein